MTTHPPLARLGSVEVYPPHLPSWLP